MILNRRREIERHPNGQLSYYCTWAEVSKLFIAMYPRCIKDKDGKYWIRIGWHRKYFDNRQLAWQLKYDNFGNEIKGVSKFFRKDGSLILH